MLPVPKASASFARDAAQCLSGTSTIERLGGLHGLSTEGVRVLLDDPETQREIDRYLANAETTGEIVQWRAREGLAVIAARLQEVGANPETSVSTLIKAGELLGKLAGLSRPSPPDEVTSTFSISIIFSGNPPPSGPGRPTRDATATPVIDVPTWEISSDDKPC